MGPEDCGGNDCIDGVCGLPCTASCNPDPVKTYACSGTECYCVTPYYDPECNTAAAVLSDLRVVGTLAPGGHRYYSVTFAPSAASALVTLIGPGEPPTALSSWFQMHASAGRLPHVQSNSPPPDYSVLMPDPVREQLLLTPPTPASTPYFIEILNTEPPGGATTDYQIQVLQY